MFCSLKNDNYAKEILYSLLPASPNESFQQRAGKSCQYITKIYCPHNHFLVSPPCYRNTESRIDETNVLCSAPRTCYRSNLVTGGEICLWEIHRKKMVSSQTWSLVVCCSHRCYSNYLLIMAVSTYFFSNGTEVRIILIFWGCWKINANLWVGKHLEIFLYSFHGTEYSCLSKGPACIRLACMSTHGPEV